MQDIQWTSGYVAYNIHRLSLLAGRPIAVIAHSSGSPVTQWALRWWPSSREATRAFIALGPDFEGVWFNALKMFCEKMHGHNGVQICNPSIWQQAGKSHFMDAMAKYARKALVPTTVIWTHVCTLSTPCLNFV